MKPYDNKLHYAIKKNNSPIKIYEFMLEILNVISMRDTQKCDLYVNVSFKFHQIQKFHRRVLTRNVYV